MQIARGFSSLRTRSSSDEAAVAPCFARASVASGRRSYTTHACPPRIRRRTMPPPMRPRPIIPICMLAP